MFLPGFRERRPPTHGSGTAGFTLLELMIVVAVLAVSLTLVAPSMATLIQDNRQLSSVYALRATLNLARSEALAQRRPVVVCGSADGSSCTGSTDWGGGFLAFVDGNNDGTLTPGNPADALLHHESLSVQSLDVTYDRQRVRFDSMGAALGSDGTFVFCDERGVAWARGLILSPAGTVLSATDSGDEGDVVNDADGNDVAC